MAATTFDRNTPKQYIQRQIALQLETNAEIPGGTMVMTILGGTGKAVPAADTANGNVMGIAAGQASWLAGDRFVIVERGAFWMANDGTITLSDVGGLCTVLDNQTVSKAATTTADVGAGYIEDVDSTMGVLVAMLGGKISAA